MNSSVSVQDKKQFLEWFLSRFDPGEMEWLLEEIIQDERKLKMIRFVDRIDGCPKGISIQVGNASGVQFLFFKGNIKTRDVYTAFHELQLHGDEAYFIRMDFPDKASNFLYRVVEETDRVKKKEMEQTAEKLLDRLLFDQNIAYLKAKIDQSLDQQDQTAFHHFTTRLKECINMK